MSDNYSTELVEVSTDDAIASAIAGLQSGHDADIVTSFVGNDEDTADAVLDAIANSIPVADNLNREIAVANYIVQRVELTNEETGEVASQPRITLVDTDGNAYNVTSPVVLRDLRTILAMRGAPSSWKKPLVVKFERLGQGTRKFITMKVVSTRKPTFSEDPKPNTK